MAMAAFALERRAFRPGNDYAIRAHVCFTPLSFPSYLALQSRFRQYKTGYGTIATEIRAIEDQREINDRHYRSC